MTRRVETLMWLGLFAAPFGFALEHIFGWGVSEASCHRVDQVWGVAFRTWVWVLTSFAAASAAAGLASALLAYRAIAGTGNDDPPPEGRVWMLSICGIVVSSLLLILILLSGTGALILGGCHQA